MSDVADRIRARAADYVENILDPQSAGRAIVDVLDLCDRFSVDLEGKPSLVGKAFATEIRTTIAKAFGIEVTDE